MAESRLEGIEALRRNSAPPRQGSLAAKGSKEIDPSRNTHVGSIRRIAVSVLPPLKLNATQRIRKFMSRQLSFERNINKVLVSADSLGVWIVAGWTVGIPKDTAIQYVKHYDSSPAEGFYKHEGEIKLSHGAGKIYLSEPEADAIIALIKATYM